MKFALFPTFFSFFSSVDKSLDTDSILCMFLRFLTLSSFFLSFYCYYSFSRVLQTNRRVSCVHRIQCKRRERLDASNRMLTSIRKQTLISYHSSRPSAFPTLPHPFLSYAQAHRGHDCVKLYLVEIPYQQSRCRATTASTEYSQLLYPACTTAV